MLSTKRAASSADSALFLRPPDHAFLQNGPSLVSPPTEPLISIPMDTAVNFPRECQMQGDKDRKAPCASAVSTASDDGGVRRIEAHRTGLIGPQGLQGQ